MSHPQPRRDEFGRFIGPDAIERLSRRLDAAIAFAASALRTIEAGEPWGPAAARDAIRRGERLLAEVAVVLAEEDARA